MHISAEPRSSVKLRNEIKYLASEGMLQIIEARIAPLCFPDLHNGTNGYYTIRSLYFDDPHNTCLSDNENGIDPRFKYRIRMYDHNTDYIVLEQKCKRHGLNFKRSCRISNLFCHKLLAGEFDPTTIPVAFLHASPDSGQLLTEFYADYQMNLFRPKVIVEYSRTAYVYETGNVRITLDRSISASGEIGCFLSESPNFFPVMPPGIHVLEVKYDDFLPDFLYHSMERIGCIHTAYSKYYYSRQFCG